MKPIRSRPRPFQRSKPEKARQGKLIALVVRHPQATSNVPVPKRVGRADFGVTKKGREQVEALVQRMLRVPLDRIESSPMIRAKEAASRIGGSQAIRVKTNPLLAERDYGAISGVPDHLYDELLRASGKKPWKFEVGGENQGEVRKRAAKWLNGLVEKDLPKPGETRVVAGFTHHDTASAIAAEATKMRRDADFEAFRIGNTGMFALEYDAGKKRWNLLNATQVPHLETSEQVQAEKREAAKKILDRVAKRAERFAKRRSRQN